MHNSCFNISRNKNVKFRELTQQARNEYRYERLSSWDQTQNRVGQVGLELAVSFLDDVKVVADSEAEIAAVGHDEA